MIEGINGAPFIDMSPYIDTKQLESLFVPVARGIAKYGPLPIAYFPPKTKDQTYKDMNDLDVCDDKSIEDEYLNTLTQLTAQERYRFAELTNKVISAGGYIELRHSKSRRYKDIFEQSLCEDNKSAISLFPELMQFVKTLPFESIGRIVIFVSNPFVEGQIHSDLATAQEYLFPPLENKKAYKNQNFIWFNPSGRKKFFVYDEDTKEKHIVDTKACFFNTWDYHGSESTDETTFSFRVDGKFIPGLKQTLKL